MPVICDIGVSRLCVTCVERLQVLKVNGCDKLGDSSLLALCARTWRLYNPRRDKHPVPLRFFDSFLPDTFKASGAVSVQVLCPGLDLAGTRGSA